MTDGERTQQPPQGKRERFQAELRARAERIRCVYNDVFTIKIPQLVAYFILGMCAVALLVVAMIFDGGIRVGAMLGGIAVIIVLVVWYLAMRAAMPMSFMQYTAFDNGKRYTFCVVGKKRSLFSDGENIVETDRQQYRRLDEMPFLSYRCDFFADMTVDVRIGKAETETFAGTTVVNGKTVKCKIVFRNGEPYIGNVGGVRIKYFDVNSTNEKFVVPQDLRAAVKAFGVPMPKLGGIVVK